VQFKLLCTFPALATHRKTDDEGHASTRKKLWEVGQKKPEAQWAWRILHTQMWMRLEVSSHGQRDEWITHDRGNLIHPCGLAKDFLSNDSGVRACVRVGFWSLSARPSCCRIHLIPWPTMCSTSHLGWWFPYLLHSPITSDILHLSCPSTDTDHDSYLSMWLVISSLDSNKMYRRKYPWQMQVNYVASSLRDLVGFWVLGNSKNAPTYPWDTNSDPQVAWVKN
jgi:hypothetical protein